MNNLSVFLTIFVVTTIINTDRSVAWQYEHEDQWPDLCKHGKRQSPIALSRHVAKEAEFPPLKFHNYRSQFLGYIKNNGHSAEIRFYVQDPPNVVGGNLPDMFILDHLHFHWQSEHTINSYRYPLELHLVHYAKRYGNLSEAVKRTNGVAVFSVLFDLSADDEQEFAPLIETIGQVHDHVDQVVEKTIELLYYLPRDTSGYYRYNGSLTTPGCNEGVLWTVFTNTIPISKAQVAHFETMVDKDQHKLPHTYRSLQPINNRPIYLKVSPIRNSVCSVTGINQQIILQSAFLSLISIYLL